MIPIVSREEITDLILNYLEVDGLYITSAQDRAKYFRNTVPASTPFGTSGTHSALEIIVESVVHGLTDYYGLSATSGDYNHISIYGDVVGSGTSAISTTISNNVITTAKLVNNAVTLAKMTTMATGSFLGRTAAGTGNVEVIPLTAISPYIDVSDDIDAAIADALVVVDAAIAAAIAGIVVSGGQTITMTGDVTGTGTSAISTTIANDSVTLAKIQNVATASILGRSTAGTGDLEVLSVTSTRNLLGLGTGDTPTFAGINATSLNITNLTVSNDLLVSGDFFNPHVSILADGVISTDNIIYTEYLEVYNTATFDADVNVLGHEIVTGWLNVSGTFSAVGNANFSSDLIVNEYSSSSYGRLRAGSDAYQSFEINANTPVVIAADSAFAAMFQNGQVYVGTSQTQPTSTIHGGGSFASVFATLGTNQTLGAQTFIEITASSTQTLPAASSCPGRAYYILRNYTGVGTAYVDRAGSDTMEINGTTGITSYPLTAHGKFVLLVSNGSNKWISFSDN